MLRLIRVIFGFVPHAVQGHMSWTNLFDLIFQSMVFSIKSMKIKRIYPGKFVGLANREIFIGDSIHEVFDSAQNKYPKRMVYFEPVNFTINF